MPKLVVCSVFDVKVGAFAAPFFVRTKGEAVRSFEDACKDDKLPFKNHPGDYRLVVLAEFDDSTGRLDMVEQVILCEASEFAPLR